MRFLLLTLCWRIYHKLLLVSSRFSISISNIELFIVGGGDAVCRWNLPVEEVDSVLFSCWASRGDGIPLDMVC